MTTGLFTIGHSNRPIGSFIKLLQAHGVELLADIRRFPGSRKHPQYGRDSLAAALADAGIDYVFLGDTLGGRRARSQPPDVSPNGGLANASFRNYADHMLTAEFRQGVGELLELAARKTVCVMCSEGWWVKCHRRLLADYLVARGMEVRHISSRVRADPHILDPAAVATGDGVIYPRVLPRLAASSESVGSAASQVTSPDGP